MTNISLINSLIGALIVAIVTFVVRTNFRVQRKSREPPLVPAIIPIPYLGHVIGLLRQRTDYYTNLSKKWSLPIFTIAMFGGKVHVVNSAALMSAFHKLPKTVSFWFMVGVFTSKLSGMSKNAAQALTANLTPDSKEPSLMIAGLKATQQAMSQNGGMDEMNRAAAEVTKSRMDSIQDSAGIHVDLWDWVQHEITIATTECVYGPANPYRDPKVERAFWKFNDDIITILMATTGVLPKLFASNSLAARETVIRAMQSYFSSEASEYTSPLIKARLSALKDNIDQDDLARFECTNGIAILSNTVPAAFWAIFHVYSDPVLLDQVRSQVRNITTTTSDGLTQTIDLRRLKDAPIIFSVIQEALRYRATGTGPRMIMEDVAIETDEDQYLLRKDSVVIIANKALHFDSEVWGSDADVFMADRFCRKTSSSAFRGFGGGANFCPGRGFAMVEVGAMLSMLVMRFDMISDSTDWSEPGQDMTNMALQIAPPKEKVSVRILPRQTSAYQKWNFQL